MESLLIWQLQQMYKKDHFKGNKASSFSITYGKKILKKLLNKLRIRKL